MRCIFILLENNPKKLLIVSITPSFLEKGVDWFSQNFSEMEKNRLKNDWWKRNTGIIEIGQKISLSEFLRKIAELGYTKVWEASHKGEFSQRGGIIRIFPINSDKIFSVEFECNKICEITESQGNMVEDLEKKSKKLVSNPLSLIPGDYVVHIDHGIGIFKEERGDDFIIEYAAKDALFVPKTSASKRLMPYLGFKTPRISRLGTPLWSITKKKAKEDIVKFAKELLESLAKRKISRRVQYTTFFEEEEKLENSFPHQNTPDQTQALEEIFSDLAKETPMERILIGDVGFGKTEVALRASFRVVLNGKQVAILAPTTILADQHFELFKKRLDEFGISVSRLTRLEDREVIKKIEENLASGALDIVIGTHKILSKNLIFKSLGLLIIDEEQKFGVEHKEYFKKQNSSLDTLILSATPIPRTLNIALSGIAGISRIETAPNGRQEIKTYVLPKNKKVMRDAINHEILRGGQVYFLANRIHKMPQILEEIKNLKTKAKIKMLHGRMGEKTIIKTMRDFREKKFNLLLSSTIIENGLDISEANTLIVEDATKLGLSQAHQLRGRIGRGEKEAHAYFLYSTHKLKEKAAERLEALERYAWLGAGFEIAKRDLEIRGAGNILGKAQSGIAYRVGLNLYFQLLEEAIDELKTKQ